mgnify:CR=1 FL=1
MTSKACKYCQIVKPLNEFVIKKNANYNDSITNKCKECHNEYHRINMRSRNGYNNARVRLNNSELNQEYELLKDFIKVCLLSGKKIKQIAIEKGIPYSRMTKHIKQFHIEQALLNQTLNQTLN